MKNHFMEAITFKAIVWMTMLVTAGVALAAQPESRALEANDVFVEAYDVYYVATTGSDANPGTRDKPFQTLTQAQRAVRGSNANMKGDIVVCLRGGTYTLTRTLTFTSADSGTNGHQVIYRAYAGEMPIISGGKTVTGWTLHDAKRNIWQATVAATDNFRQIYVNGIKAVRAHDSGKLGLKLTDTGFHTTDQRLQSFGNITDMEVVAQSRPWTQQRFPVAGISGSDIRIKEPCWSQITHDHNYYSKPRADMDSPRLENAYEFLRSPGCWYLDRTTHTLFYIPRDGENMATATVEVPVLEQLVLMAGSDQKPVSNLTISGLTFRLSNWLQPSTDAGMYSGQANQGKMQEQPGDGRWTMKAAVDCLGAHRVQVTDCVLEQLGGIGMNLLEACRDDTVDHCRFHDIAGGAIQVGTVDPAVFKLPLDSGEIVANDIVSNCTIHDVARDYQASCAVFFGYTQECTIAHNEIYNVPYSAISLGWGWTNESMKAAYTKGNRILANKIHDHMQVLVDGGGIYCNGYQQGGLIEGNYIYNQGYKYALLYLDDGAANWTVTGNVCQGADKERAWYLYKGINNDARHNFSDHSFVYVRNTGPCTVTDTTVVHKGLAWPVEAIAIMINE